VPEHVAPAPVAEPEPEAHAEPEPAPEVRAEAARAAEAPHADHRDSDAYSDEAFSADAFGANAFTGGYTARASGGILAKDDFGGDSLVSRVTEEVDVFGLPVRTEQSGPESHQAAPESLHAAPPETPSVAEPETVAAPAAPRSSGQVDASVNGLFAGSNVAASDDAAASTLAGAFGGTQPEAPQEERAVRPAKNELSLDTVFRESPGEANPTRRESSAFSFDQFFGSDANADNVSPIEGANGNDDSAGNETEQFSSWLSGLKKK